MFIAEDLRDFRGRPRGWWDAVRHKDRVARSTKHPIKRKLIKSIHNLRGNSNDCAFVRTEGMSKCVQESKKELTVCKLATIGHSIGSLDFE